jgi:uncharacterized repeat protein (TIGR03803 family)
MKKLPAIVAGILICICALTWPSLAQTFRDLGKFDYDPDGAYPYGYLVQGLDGKFYGEASGGGTHWQDCISIVGCGTIYRSTSPGGLSQLYSFCAQPGCSDGESPNGGLLLATDGNFYGVTYRGGANGSGAIFQITPAGDFTTIYSFCSGCNEGIYPIGGLIQGRDGNLYGTSSMSGKYNGGTVFKITLSGVLTTIHAFCAETDCADGSVPESTLVQAANGNFYGTTISGGINSVGTVYEITPSGQFTTLYKFCSLPNCTDGKYPFANLIQATDGNLYGTTAEGGTYGPGTIFQITTSGQLTTLHSFCAQTNCSDGANPGTGLVQASDGRLYGSAGGGDSTSCELGCGILYKFSPPANYQVIYNFCPTGPCSDGADPSALMQGTDGVFYGALESGGQYGLGTVYGFSIGLPAFVNTLPTAGTPGTQVIILGNGLTGTSSVTFNGMQATFNVVSDTELTATVPSGAISGKVQVVTPTGTLSTIQNFQVFD